MNREDAYVIIQSLSHQALREDRALKYLIQENQTLKPLISEDDFNNLFNLEKHLIHVDYIFERVFGSHILS